ncbi:heme lyase CcmF/NrfE family subunit [Prosthecomicrobium hirschii]|uniref:heme lyase CcmF/NrfE family subunit n=1 Tax=Prosthecodimorpha hirschii TaxID=665126 RepID=UPI00221E4E3E|nr:heme lyase CcmF/NrfE family subunit [Prosthecomicrobium hirschii]MCW1840603.1 heme lyase CcmF/NrfE family subunit [Prosthecomicrobium hirschii]
MIVEIGHYALVLAFALALVQSILPVWGARTRDAQLMAVAGPAALAQFLFVAIAFGALTWAAVVSDFSVANVFENSHSAKPLQFKISGVWGNHEGSMLLWVLILALFGAMVAAFGRNLPETLKANALGVQAWIASAFLLFILATSNPFQRLSPAPMEGRDLNPILQDWGLAIHPPLLYLGYVGFSISFAFAVAALIDGRIDAAWARWVRPWTLAAWVFLTLGIAMGSYWAYYELGWGGWWFWDPVENASFMPWLSGTALLHSAIVMEKRNALKVWTILLAILTFSLSLLGTFLVRSGVLTSVHAFATDPARGVFILMILTLFIGGSLALFAWRGSTLTQGGIFAPISREGALVFNNLFLTVSCLAVFVGTLYPLVLEAVTGDKISVGAPFFNVVFGIIVVPLLLVVPIGPFLAWKRGDLGAVAERLAVALVVALVVAAITGWISRGVAPVLAALGFGLAAWLVVGALAEFAFRIRLFAEPLGTSLRRARGLPRSAWGMTIAHVGVGLSVIGIVAESAWKTEHILIMKPNDTVEVAGMTVQYQGSAPRKGPNFQEQAGVFAVSRGGVLLTTLRPAKRFYPARQMPTTEAAIGQFDLYASNLYISLGDAQTDGGMAVRIYWKPFVNFIWYGCVVMALGGFVSLSDRRLRVGAPVPARLAGRVPAGAAE